MPKGLREYLHKTEDAMFIQGRVPKPLGKRVKAQLEKEGISWPNFLKASCQRFLAETEGKSSSGIKSMITKSSRRASARLSKSALPPDRRSLI